MQAVVDRTLLSDDYVLTQAILNFAGLRLSFATMKEWTTRSTPIPKGLTADRKIFQCRHAAACKQAWRTVFRRALREDGCMCLCGVLGAEADALPSEVATEVRSFFKLGMESLTRAIGKSGQMTPEEAAHMLATLEGAMLLALTLGDVAFFDKATASLA